jgi:hypothetical protein
LHRRRRRGERWIGHVLTPQKKHYSYADIHRRYRKHAEPRRDYDADYDRDGNYIDRR